MGACGCFVKCCTCAIVAQLVAAALLLALVPTGYLTYELYLKPWGEEHLADYAASGAGALSADATGAASVLSGGAACIKCPGVNVAYPVTEASHPTYGAFQVAVMNNAGWFTSMLATVGVAVGGGGSLLVSLLSAVHGVSMSAASGASSTAQNGCGIFEMVALVSQAQFVTMLGALSVEGAPVFFLEFVRKLAWTNLQIFPREVEYDATKVAAAAAAAASTIGASATRHLLTFDADAAASAKGVERYALLIGVKPDHLFYYTCLALAVVLGGVLVLYLLLRVAIGTYKREVASTLDHRVIWVYLQLLVLAQYIISMTSCFQIYYTVTTNRSAGDLGLAIVILAASCIGLLVFGVIKVARHREEIQSHGTPAHDDSKPFHLRYSVFYQDFTVENIYFFAAKMVLDVASGAIIGTVQDASYQITILVGLNVVFLLLLIWRQPYLVPLFYYVSVIAGYLRVVLLMLTLVQAHPDLFPQEARDLVAVIIISINAVLLMCILIRQFYVLCVAIFKWRTRAKKSPADEEMGIPLQEMSERPRKSLAASATTTATSDKPSSSKTSSGKSRSSRDRVKAPTSPIDDSTLFSAQPYHQLESDTPANARHSMPAPSSQPRRSGSSGKGNRRSLYSQQRARSRQRQFVPVKDEQLPDWAKV